MSTCLSLYGLTARGALRPLSGGNVGHSALVDTARGPMVIKRCSDRFDDSRLHLAAAAHDHAAAAGLAPRLIRTLDGALLANCAAARFTVTEFADSTVRPDPLSFAAALAALHRRLENFAPASPWPNNFLELPDPPDARLQQLRAQPGHGANATQIDHRLHLLRAIGLSAPEIAEVARPWVHGDAHSGNLLTVGTPSRALFIDFDQVSRFPRSYELLRAFFSSLDPTADPTVVSGDLRKFTNAYESEAPLPAHERAIMVELFITVQAAETRTFTTAAREVRGMSGYAEERHRRLAWLAEHHGVLRRALGKEYR